MAYLNLDVDYFDHPKVKRLVRLLGKGSEVLPLKLWVYAARYFADDGRLTGISAQEIEDECRWWGKSGEMVRVMLLPEILFLECDGETFKVHDWEDHEGHIKSFKQRARAAAAKRWWKDDAPSNAPSIPTSNAPTNPTQPKPTHDAARKTVVVDRDSLDAEIHRYFMDSTSIVWDRVSHSKLRKLVESAGWEASRSLIDEAVRLGKPFPVGWALGKFGRGGGDDPGESPEVFAARMDAKRKAANG